MSRTREQRREYKAREDAQERKVPVREGKRPLTQAYLRAKGTR